MRLDEVLARCVAHFGDVAVLPVLPRAGRAADPHPGAGGEGRRTRRCDFAGACAERCAGKADAAAEAVLRGGDAVADRGALPRFCAGSGDKLAASAGCDARSYGSQLPRR